MSIVSKRSQLGEAHDHANHQRSSFGGCSRRVFLENALAGAAAVVTTQAIDRPIGAAMLDAAPAAARGELADLNLHEAAALVRQKKVSPLQLTQACLARIEALDSRLNSFITVTAESALAEARQAEAELTRGMWRGPLHGIPVALKDLIDTAGVRTTAASALFKERIPREDAVVVQRLRESGAVFLGKLNMYEVAFGPTTQATSFFGPVSNPWATDHISGGSSSGGGAPSPLVFVSPQSAPTPVVQFDNRPHSVASSV